jgi:SAM-dependent methyltransferase
VDKDEYKRMAENGERHWWYRSTRTLLKQLLEPHLSGAAGSRCLDAAGGTGATGGWMTEHAPTVLVDFEPFTLEVAMTDYPGLLTACADINTLPFDDASFDLVLCVTALCHRMNPDPGAIVAEFHRVAKPGAIICLMEPGGGKWLWRSHDDVTQSARRFSVRSLRSIAEGAGLDVIKATGVYSFLVPPAYAMHIFERGSAKSDVGRNQSGLGGALGAVARMERRFLRRFNLPVGLSSVVIARVPN